MYAYFFTGCIKCISFVFINFPSHITVPWVNEDDTEYDWLFIITFDLIAKIIIITIFLIVIIKILLMSFVKENFRLSGDMVIKHVFTNKGIKNG